MCHHTQLLQDWVEARISYLLVKCLTPEPHPRLSLISLVEKGHTAACSHLTLNTAAPPLVPLMFTHAEPNIPSSLVYNSSTPGTPECPSHPPLNRPGSAPNGRPLVKFGGQHGKERMTEHGSLGEFQKRHRVTEARPAACSQRWV